MTKTIAILFICCTSSFLACGNPEPDTQNMVKIAGGELVSGGEDHPIINFLRAQSGGYSEAFLSTLCEPPRTIRLQNAFYIDIYETTNYEYSHFLQYIKQTGDHKTFCHQDETLNKDHTSRYNDDINYMGTDQPVVGIDWFDAYAYAQFARKSLPTDDQWEIAARGEEGRLYPWGSTFYPTLCNISHAHIVVPVTGDRLKNGATPDGIRHMAGNVSEWTLGQSKHNSRMRSLRGGGCYDKPAEIYAMSYLRFFYPETSRETDAGFRCISYTEKPDTLTTYEQLQEDTSRYPEFADMASEVFVGDDGKEYMLYYTYKYYFDLLKEYFPKRQRIPSGIYKIGGPEDAKTLSLARKIGPAILEDLAKIRPKSVVVEGFFIDSMEVANKEYVEFLNSPLAQTHWYCHPDEPGSKNHTPEYIGYERFSQGDQPVVGVDWWDAYAYARFRGKRLPTAFEWEFCARGQEGRLYPWGDQFKKGVSNTLSVNLEGQSFIGTGLPRPGKQFPEDKTTNCVYDLGGNVAEWTSTIESNERGRKMAVLKGGHFKFRGDLGSLTYRKSRAAREVRDTSIGFRCATDGQ